MGSKRAAVAAVLAAVCAMGSWAVADDAVVPMVWAPAGASAGGDGDWDLVTPNFVEGSVPGPLTTWVNDGMRSATFNGMGARYLVHMQDVIVATAGIVVNSPYTFIGLAGGAIDVGGGSITTGELAGVVPFAVPLTGAGGVTVSAATGSTVEFTEPNTYAGGTTVNAGTLRVAGGGTLGDPSGVLTVNGNVFPPVFPPAGDGATVQVMSSQTVGGLAGTGGLVSLGDQVTLTVNQQVDGAFFGRVAGPGTLVKTGPGTLRTGVGTLDLSEPPANVSVVQGTLVANDWFYANHVDIAAGATLEARGNGAPNFKVLSGTGTLAIDVMAGIDPAAADGFAGKLAGSGTFVKSGPAPYSLTGTYDFAGHIWVIGGPLTVGPGIHTSYSLSQGATLNAPADAPLLVRPGEFIQGDNGSATLHNTVVGSVNCLGYLRLYNQPALAANLTITGDLTYGAVGNPAGWGGAGLSVFLDPAAGGVADELVVGGALTIAGPVGVFPNSLVPGADVLGSSYALIEYGTFDGLLNDPAGLHLEPSWASKFTLVNDPAQHTIFLVAVPEPGVLPVVMGGVGAAVMAGRRQRGLRQRA
jgi:autotransporter-associated beta strand protein